MPIHIQDELADQLSHVSHELGKTENWVINEALREYFSRKAEEEQRWQQTKQAIESAEQGNVTPSELVIAWLDSWGKPDELPPPCVNGD